MDAMVTDDQALVARLAAGEPGALDMAYRQHGPAVWRFLVRLCGGHEADAKDLFQETWVAVARSARSLRADTRLLPWLYTVARNKHVSLHRGMVTELRRRLGWGATMEHQSPATPEATAGVRSRTAAVHAAFARLAPQSREVLLLCLVEELPTPQVAEVLGLRQDAVRKRLSRARAELEAVLGGAS